MSIDPHQAFVNFGYSDVNEFEPVDKDNIEVVDLIQTNIVTVSFENYPNLRKLRLAKCNNLNSVKVTNCPKLKVLDCANSTQLEQLTLQDLPQLQALDISFTKLREFNAYLPSLLFFNCQSISFIPNPENIPSLLSIDISESRIDLTFLKLLPKIERIIFWFGNNQVFPLREVLEIKTLKSLIVDGIKADISKDGELNTNVQRFLYKSCRIEGIELLNGKIPYMSDGSKGELIPPSKDTPKWLCANRLLYGPWGIPPCDRSYDLTFLPNATPLPCKVIDKIYGAVIGSALGDCLGVSAEFSNSRTCHARLETALDISWSHMLYQRRVDNFTRGTSTDDTDQSVFVMRSYDKKKPDLNKFAKEMKRWASEGIVEHKHGYCFDIGNTTRAAVQMPKYEEDPIRAAKEACQSHSVGNGSAMRTAAVGCIGFESDKTVLKNAKLFSQATHYHPDCVLGASIISLLVARFIQKSAGIVEDVDVDQTVKDALKACPVDNKAEKMRLLGSKNLEDLSLDGRDMGYVLRSVAAALICLRNGWTYKEAISRVIICGGDADTNAAIVGAVIGARDGFSALPYDLVRFLYNGNWIARELERVLAENGYISEHFAPFEVLSYSE